MSIQNTDDQIEQLEEEIETLRQRVNAFESLETKRMEDAVTVDDWRRIAQHMEYQWRCCSDGFNRRCGELMAELAALKREKQHLINGIGQGEPVATLHDDGHWTFTAHASDLIKHESNYAGWRLPVYTSAPTIPEGYVLVPVEPTPEMLNAAWGPASHDWPAMLAVTLKPKEE